MSDHYEGDWPQVRINKLGMEVDRLDEELAAEKEKSARLEGLLFEGEGDSTEIVSLTVAEENQATRAPTGPGWRLRRARVQFNPQTGRFALVCIWTAPPLTRADE